MSRSTESPVETIAVDPVVADALARARPAEELIEVGFAAASIDDRLDEIDALVDRDDGSQLEAVIDAPPAPASRVAGSVRALPGGPAFAELLDDDTELPGFETIVTLGSKVKALYQQVRAFLARLRDGLFGFVADLPLDPSSSMRVQVQLDSDVTLTVHTPAIATVAPAITAHLSDLQLRLRDALAVFTKVVQIIAGVVLAATSPIHAVRALWRALRALYALLVDRLPVT